MVLHALLLLFVLDGQAPPQQAPPAQPPRVAPAPRKIYNETADARAQISRAINHVKPDGTRVLIVWGANDDENCTKFQQAMAGGPDAPKLREMLNDEYEIVYVDIGHLDKNLDAAKEYRANLSPSALPHLTILDASGGVVAQGSSREFAASPGAATPFDAAKIVAFLEGNRAPAPPAAGPLFKAALEQGKREGKTIFVWFSAPW